MGYLVGLSIQLQLKILLIKNYNDNKLNDYLLEIIE